MEQPELKTREGVIISIMMGFPDYAFAVFLDLQSPTVLVPREVFLSHPEEEMSKSQLARMQTKELEYSVGSRAEVGYEPATNIAHRIRPLTGYAARAEYTPNGEQVVVFQAQVVLSPEDPGECWSELFGSIPISVDAKADCYQRNVLYDGKVRVDLELTVSGGTITGSHYRASLYGIEKSSASDEYRTKRYDAIVDPSVRIEGCLRAPWNSHRRPSYNYELPLGSDDVMVELPKPRVSRKEQHFIGSARGFILDDECLTVFCPDLPNDTVLLARSRKENAGRYHIGMWIREMVMYYSPVREAWIVVKYSHIERHSEWRKRTVQTAPLGLRNGGHHLLAQDERATVWARLAHPTCKAKFIADHRQAQDDSVATQPREWLISGTGVYLGGADRPIYCLDRPFLRLPSPWCYDALLRPGDRVSYTALWNNAKQSYVPINFALTGEPLFETVLTSQGPAVHALLEQEREQLFWNDTFQNIEDPQNVLKSDNDDESVRPAEQVWIVPGRRHGNSTTPFVVLSQARPSAVGVLVQLEATTPSLLFTSAELRTELMNIFRDLLASPQKGLLSEHGLTERLQAAVDSAPPVDLMS
ncbi:hypothetical protein AAVH_02576 [Aphelenchoides avenae]|nr:hypothetical protein AAVH_02576 [Aphelenchus avenae]